MFSNYILFKYKILDFFPDIRNDLKISSDCFCPKKGKSDVKNIISTIMKLFHSLLSICVVIHLEKTSYSISEVMFIPMQ